MNNKNQANQCVVHSSGYYIRSNGGSVWFLLQGSIIVGVSGWLHDKTPNGVARGIIGFAAAWLATVILSIAIDLWRRIAR